METKKPDVFLFMDSAYKYINNLCRVSGHDKDNNMEDQKIHGVPFEMFYTFKDLTERKEKLEKIGKIVMLIGVKRNGN